MYAETSFKIIALYICRTQPSAHLSVHLTVCAICRGFNINSNAAPFKLAPLRLASWRSHPDKSQFCNEIYRNFV